MSKKIIKLKVLVVDDEESILQTFKLRLTKWGHKVFLASNGTQCLEILSENEFNVVITDLKMPGLSGRELVKRVRELYPKTEVVVITGYATVESAVDVMKFDYPAFYVLHYRNGTTQNFPLISLHINLNQIDFSVTKI